MEFKPEGFTGFNFRRTDFESRFGRGHTSMAASGQGMLVGFSNFIVAPNCRPMPSPQPRSASLLVEVTDLNQQTLTRRVEFVRHSSDFYLGLREAAEVVSAGKPLPLEVVAVRADGQPWAELVKAQLNLRRIDWRPVRVQGAGRTIRYRNESVVTNVLTQDIEIQPVRCQPTPRRRSKGNRLPDFPTLPAGQYLVELKAKDSAERPVVSSLSFDVLAPAETGWNYRNDVQLALKPDRKSYAPGETAKSLSKRRSAARPS